ncbi:hypothetical protein ACSBR2_017522 [Camellia fascicularis]
MLVFKQGKEIVDPGNGRQCPFFEELHAVFIEREKGVWRTLLESESGASHAKKRVKRIGGDPSSEELSNYEYEDEVESFIPQKKKGEIEKRLRIAGSDKASRQPNIGNTNNSGNNLSSIQEMLEEFLQQQ